MASGKRRDGESYTDYKKRLANKEKYLRLVKKYGSILVSTWTKQAKIEKITKEK